MIIYSYHSNEYLSIFVLNCRTSNRKILFYLFNENKLQYLFMHDMSSLPSFLTPYYDDDTRILYLAGRGENTVHFICLELNPSSKSNDVEQQCLSIKPLESYRFPTNHLAIDFLPRKQCCVRNCEIAIGIRMFMNGFERFRYRVPRNHVSFFLFTCFCCIELNLI